MWPNFEMSIFVQSVIVDFPQELMSSCFPPWMDGHINLSHICNTTLVSDLLFRVGMCHAATANILKCWKTFCNVEHKARDMDSCIVVFYLSALVWKLQSTVYYMIWCLTITCSHDYVLMLQTQSWNFLLSYSGYLTYALKWIMHCIWLAALVSLKKRYTMCMLHIVYHIEFTWITCCMSWPRILEIII